MIQKLTPCVSARAAIRTARPRVATAAGATARVMSAKTATAMSNAMNDEITPDPAAESDTSEAACSACPFCGTRRFNVHTEMFAAIRNAARVKCECGADGPRGFGDTEEEAVKNAMTLRHAKPCCSSNSRSF